MTPVEKASQMIVDYQLTFKSLSYEEAVQCSIRTVDDILQELELVCVDEMVQFSNRWKYWEEVKELLQKQLNKMTLRHALLILQSHQKWRMGDEFAEKTEPKVLTEAINTILQYHIGSTTALIDHIVDINKMVSSQIEISDEEIKKLAELEYPYDESVSTELKGIIVSAERAAWIEGIKWYREKLKEK